MLPQRYYKWLLYGAGILVPTGLATAYYFHTRATHKPSKITLNIFDFDGTVFKSPLPTQHLYSGSLLAKLMEDKAKGGLGWFQDELTLSDPYVPATPASEWYNDDVIAKVRLSMAAKDSVTVLLTGRSTKYQKLVHAILAHANLIFDEEGYKPLSDEDLPLNTTMDFKQQYISQVIKKYNPNFVNIYDDRPHHCKKFEEYLAQIVASKETNIESFVVHSVPNVFLPLSEELEAELVKKLVERNYKGEGVLKSVVSYTGVFLDEKSVKLILDTFKVPEGWTVKAHHMTICLGTMTDCFKNGENSNLKLGDSATLQVVAVGTSEKAMAIQVECSTVVSNNKIPHVTIAISPNGRPKDSNDIQEWTDVKGTKQAIVLNGTVKEFIYTDLVGGKTSTPQKTPTKKQFNNSPVKKSSPQKNQFKSEHVAPVEEHNNLLYWSVLNGVSN